MPSIQSLLDKYGLSYDELKPAERETLNQWMRQLSTKQLQVSDIQAYIKDMIAAVERSLVELEEPKTFWAVLFHKKRDLHLKARLKNYLLLADFLTGPDKARKWVEQQVENLKNN